MGNRKLPYFDCFPCNGGRKIYTENREGGKNEPRPYRLNLYSVKIFSSILEYPFNTIYNTTDSSAYILKHLYIDCVQLMVSTFKVLMEEVLICGAIKGSFVASTIYFSQQQ